MHTIYDSWCQRSLPLDVPNKCLWSCHLSTLPHNSKWQQHEMVDAFVSTDNNHPQTHRDTLANFSPPSLSSSASAPSPPHECPLLSLPQLTFGRARCHFVLCHHLFYNTQYLYSCHMFIGGANTPVVLWRGQRDVPSTGGMMSPASCSHLLVMSSVSVYLLPTSRTSMDKCAHRTLLYPLRQHVFLVRTEEPVVMEKQQHRLCELDWCAMILKAMFFFCFF